VELLGGRGGQPDPGASGSGVPSTWFVLHGYRQLAARFIRRFRSVAGSARRIVAPEALSRFYLEAGGGRHGRESRVGASWMTREDRRSEIRDYVRYLDRVAHSLPGCRGRPPDGHRTVLGFSQGAHTAARWVALGTFRPHRLVLWGAGLPSDLPAEAGDRLAGIEVVLVRGATDALRDRVEEAREEERLREWGVTWRTLGHEGGHAIVAEVARDLARAESLRTRRRS
jgi:predicted esterase